MSPTSLTTLHSCQSDRPSLTVSLCLRCANHARIGVPSHAIILNGQPHEPAHLANANTAASSVVSPPTRPIPTESTVTNFPQVIALVPSRSPL